MAQTPWICNSLNGQFEGLLYDILHSLFSCNVFLTLNFSLGVGAETLSRKELFVSARQIGGGLMSSSNNRNQIILTLEEIAIWLAKNAPNIPNVVEDKEECSVIPLLK